MKAVDCYFDIGPSPHRPAASLEPQIAELATDVRDLIRNIPAAALIRAYRVGQARFEELRGRPFREGRLDVKLALLAWRWLGSTVLQHGS